MPTSTVCPEETARETTLAELIPKQNQVEVLKVDLTRQKRPADAVIDLQKALIEKRTRVDMPPEDELVEAFIIQPRMKNAPVLASGSMIKDPAVALSVALVLSLPLDRKTFCAEPDIISIALATQSTILAKLESEKKAKERAKVDVAKAFEAGLLKAKELYADKALKFENRGFKHGWMKALVAAKVTMDQAIPYEQQEVEPLELDPGDLDP
ncbi:hypothetical protein CsSME_00015549 [Camellia sinensis var. sinensis]